MDLTSPNLGSVRVCFVSAKAAVLSSSREWPPLPSRKRAESGGLFDTVHFQKAGFARGPGPACQQPADRHECIQHAFSCICFCMLQNIILNAHAACHASSWCLQVRKARSQGQCSERASVKKKKSPNLGVIWPNLGMILFGMHVPNALGLLSGTLGAWGEGGSA